LEKTFSRTIKIPVHYSITKSKVNKLNKIASKLTYAVKLFSDKIKETNKINRKELSIYEKEIQKTTGLNSAYVQQAKDKAIWMWKSYNKLHKKWEYKLKRTSNEKYYNKLLKREPSEPFFKSNNKIS
jgi:putative transposase